MRCGTDGEAGPVEGFFGGQVRYSDVLEQFRNEHAVIAAAVLALH